MLVALALGAERCAFDETTACSNCSYVSFRMLSNDKYLAPREHSVIFASVGATPVAQRRVPLESVAWRVVPQKGRWVRLQHASSGRWLRLTPPPSETAWVLTAEADAQRFGKQTWWSIEEAGQFETTSARTVRLRVHPSASGAHVNYRGEEFVRGHGNHGPPWKAAGPLPSTRIGLTPITASALRDDIASWAAVKRRCLAPCAARPDAPAGTWAVDGAWADACGEQFAAATCRALARAHDIRTSVSWGTAPPAARARWARLFCDEYVPYVPPPTQAAAAARAVVPTSAECTAPVDGLVTLLVSDRPNQFLCHYFVSALLHGIRPT